MNIKESLIKLAEENKFVGYFSKNWEYSPNESLLRDYFWLCELHKWLMDEHNICVHIIPFQNIFTIYIYDLTDGIEIDGFENYTKDCNTYEEALEYGLQDALKLINE